MRPSILIAARAALLAGPVVLAFSSGGFFDRARALALVVTGVALVLCAVGADRPRPPRGPGLLALAGLAGLCGWVALSASWSPVPQDAHADAQRVLLYLGAFAAGMIAWRERGAARLVEPAVALAAWGLVAYGL